MRDIWEYLTPGDMDDIRQRMERLLGVIQRGELRASTENASEWRTIDTAPKDGTFVLVYGPHSRANGYPGRQLVVRWHGRAWESADDGYGVYLTPTHWMTLPKGPNASLKEQP